MGFNGKINKCSRHDIITRRHVYFSSFSFDLNIIIKDIIYLLFNYRPVGEFAFIALSLKTLFGRRIHLHHAAMALTFFLFLNYSSIICSPPQKNT